MASTFKNKPIETPHSVYEKPRFIYRKLFDDNDCSICPSMFEAMKNVLHQDLHNRY